MKRKQLHKLFFGLFTITLLCCRPTEIKKPEDYFVYLANPENGLVKEKNIAGIQYKIKYLPTDYLVYNIFKNGNYSQNSKDSLFRSLENSLTFLLNIGPSTGEDFDITRLGVNNYQEFAVRLEEMAFRSQEWMLIKAGNQEYKPKIVRMENINAQDNSRNFIVVFSAVSGKEDLRKKDLCFCYDDVLFNTGTNKFIFRSDDISNLPDFKF